MRVGVMSYDKDRKETSWRHDGCRMETGRIKRKKTGCRQDRCRMKT